VSQHAAENVTVSFKMEDPQKINEGMNKIEIANFRSNPGNSLLNKRNSLKTPPKDSHANRSEVVKKLFAPIQTNKLQMRTIVKLCESFQ
jgi:hypothetical protein